MPTLDSNKYQIKWTPLAKLPFPLCYPYVAVQDKKFYVSGGDSPVSSAKHEVFVYDVNTNCWSQLPLSGHYHGIPYIIGGKLAIIGGYLSATKLITNKVSTFDSMIKNWTSFFPDLLSTRLEPGIVIHHEHVIVAGGLCDENEENEEDFVLDDIEILNWIENSHWRKVSACLPRPMWAFTPIIANGYLYIVGFYNSDRVFSKKVYNIMINDITESFYSETKSNATDPACKWSKLTSTQWKNTAVVSIACQPMTFGGISSVTSASINKYDEDSKSWKKIGSMTSEKAGMAVATLNNNAVVIIGGYTKGDSVARIKSTSLTTVELGQAEVLKYTKPTIIPY